MTQRVAVIGLGNMGAPVAGHCRAAGFPTLGHDVDAGRVAAFRDAGGLPEPLEEALPTLDAVILFVVNDRQVETVLFGDVDGNGGGMVGRLRKGAVVICSATVPPAFAKDMAARCDAAGIGYLDAPVSGGAAGAEKGTLSVLASGAPDTLATVRPILDAYAANIYDLGPEPGVGSAMKAVNQLLCGVHIAAMAEAMAFGLTQGVAPELFARVIPTCAGTSWMLEDRAPHVVAGDYRSRSAVDIWPKDLGIVASIAAAAGFEAPLTEAALAKFRAASAAGLGAEDDAAVTKIYARQAGVTLPGD